MNVLRRKLYMGFGCVKNLFQMYEAISKFFHYLKVFSKPSKALPSKHFSRKEIIKMFLQHLS